MLIMGFDGTEIHQDRSLIRHLIEDNLGGVLLFDYDLPLQKQGKNLISTSQTKHLINQLNHYAQKPYLNYEKLPLFIAVDYEGGAVDRLQHLPECHKTLTAEKLAALPLEVVKKEFAEMARFLKSLGFNLNFAPVLDLNLSQDKGIIGKLERSFGRDSKRVADMARVFVEVFAQFGIACCYKHFPGHGSAEGDTHEGFVDVSKTYQPDELLPYQMLIPENNHPTLIMTAHVVNTHLDPTGLPATLSKRILTTLLREEFGFNGIIVSDDLQMNAIAKHYSLEEALLRTINAGADMMIFGNQLGHHRADEIIDTIESLVRSGDISQSQIEASYQRIKTFKYKNHGI